MDQNGTPSETASEYVAFDAIDDADELLDTPDRFDRGAVALLPAIGYYDLENGTTARRCC